MRWYSGGIAEAITVSKAKGAIFVVYIEGNDEESKKITNLIDHGNLGQKLESEQFVAIKIEGGSLAHQQFSEIYKEPGVPSLYFIGKNGAPLDIIRGADEPQSLISRIDSILQKAGISVAKSDAEISGNFIQSQSAEALPPSNVICENDVCTINSNVPDTETSPEEKESLTPEDKVERAKELLQKKREEKENEEKEKERLKEIERRKMGANVQQLKKWQEDQELKQIMEERDKEKRENQLARERVLAQIAQDKAERLSKSSHSKPASPDLNKPQVAPAGPRSNSYTSRLQFKLPDGSSSTQEFNHSDSLQTVVTYIKTNLNLSFTDFRLSTTFPRREFTENDFSQSLSDLQLVPNAVILILPVSSGAITTSNGSGTLTNLIWTLFGPLFQIFDYLKSFIFGPKPNVVGSKKPSEASTSKPENSRQKIRDSTVVKRQGNIHRLGDRTDSDDDGNTWNGNSTQQM